MYIHVHTHIYFIQLFPKSVKRGEENCLPSVY